MFDVVDEEENKNSNVLDRSISKEMKESFLAYSMSVIVSRALPDVRDGLKPVHRRIIYAMDTLNLQAEKQYRKSATVVGEVLGKYHPHGDSSVYDAMVRMAQDFSFRYPLVKGQGNFGSIDGDDPAAMRYTEAKMSKLAMTMVDNINEDTVDFTENYDGRELEPTVLPARFPNLLANGATGIAVGMATNIPPHNLGELIDGCLAIIDNPEISIAELNENHIFGPDFPTGASIIGRSGIRKAYETGRGSIMVRAKASIEEKKNNRKRIVVTEIPYQVNKAMLTLKIASLVNEKKIEGISDIRDESNRDGIKLIIELKREVNAEVVLNQLYKYTALQSSFGVNSLSLVKGEPKLLNLKEMLSLYIEHQIEVIEKRTAFRLRKAKDRAHILEGLKIALDNIDRVIHIIRNSSSDNEANNALREEFALSEIQAKAILDMRLARLTGLARHKLEAELNELLENIAFLEGILASRQKVLDIIKDELLIVKEKHNDERRSEIVDAALDIEDEDLIPNECVIISLTDSGYIKRVPQDTYRLQNRGGKGIKGMSTEEGDDVSHIISMMSHEYLLLFTNQGKVYRIKGYQVPSASRTAKGLPIVNLIDLDEDEYIQTVISVEHFDDDHFMFFATRNGLVKRTVLSEFSSIRQNGKIAIKLKEGDELAFARMTDGHQEIYLGSSAGKLVRFDESTIRPLSRNSSGVKGMNLDADITLVGLATSAQGDKIFTITENGYGKLSEAEHYRKSNRGAKGISTQTINEKTGKLVTLKAVEGNEDALIMTTQGVIIRISLNQINVIGRSSLGVRIIKLKDSQQVSALSIIKKDDELNT